MLKLLVLVSCAWLALGDLESDDHMISALVRGGAARAAVCASDGEVGCAGALWARHWLLTRASCLARVAQHVQRTTVLLHHGPENCRQLQNGARHPGALQPLVRFVHPAYAPDDEAPAARDPLDAALVLLAAPAPLLPVNHTIALALLPELSSWLRYVPAQVAWAHAAAPAPRPRADPARVRALDSPLRMLVATTLLPAAALLLGFLLLLRWPERSAYPHQTDEKLLVADDAKTDDAV